MIILFIVLFILMLIIGGDRGAKSFAILMLNGVIALLCIYLMGYGVNAFIVMILSSICFTLTTIITQNGYNVKTLSSIISVVCVLAFLSIIIYYICTNAQITGFNEISVNEDGNDFLSSAVSINLMQILIVSIIWGQLGAIIDTSISISTSVYEVYENNPTLSSRSLFKSGMHVGGDILGTTVNTLVFVGMGESIMLAIVYISYNYSFVKIINSKSFFQELSSILISCMGCILIIPITALLFSWLITLPEIHTYFDKVKKKQDALLHNASK